ncbi:MAG: hypothetical protein KME33_10310 [Aetokthonos hydrillicola CCALA 1050]|nr:hypothetical protein [Aetokthonos hydrillicola CCALA 1050]
MRLRYLYCRSQIRLFQYFLKSLEKFLWLGHGAWGMGHGAWGIGHGASGIGVLD